MQNRARSTATTAVATSFAKYVYGSQVISVHLQQYYKYGAYLENQQNKVS